MYEMPKADNTALENVSRLPQVSVPAPELDRRGLRACDAARRRPLPSRDKELGACPPSRQPERVRDGSRVHRQHQRT